MINYIICCQDLVAWVTVGLHHIPHTEDVPIVTTPGVQLTFWLLPYNYFDYDPAMASRDNIRATATPLKQFNYSGQNMDNDCSPRNVDGNGRETTCAFGSETNCTILSETPTEQPCTEQQCEDIQCPNVAFSIIPIPIYIIIAFLCKKYLAQIIMYTVLPRIINNLN